jgi:hypothetical protein
MKECVMKNTIKLLGIIAFVAVIGFSMIACDDGNGDDGDGGNSSLNGTWIDSDGLKMVLNNGNLTFIIDNVESIKGTYTTSGSNITVTITQVSGAVLGEYASIVGLSTTQWYTQQQLRTAIINTLTELGLSQAEVEEILDEINLGEFFLSQTGTYTLNGNTLAITFNGGTNTYTRQ